MLPFDGETKLLIKSVYHCTTMQCDRSIRVCVCVCVWLTLRTSCGVQSLLRVV